MNEKLYIIDTTGPFFVHHPETLINWSKIPFEILEKNGLFEDKTGKKIITDFEKYIDRVASIGFNAVSIDELSRLAVFPFYPPELKRKLEYYRRYYRRLFAIVKERGLRIFITTDIMFYNTFIERHTGGRRSRVLKLLKESLETLFAGFPEVDGVIFRIGESDGVDVEGDIRSRLFLKTPAQTNRCIRTLLPVFEQYGRFMIFRTWTVGAHRVGDLMWNRKTYARVFRNIRSDRLIVSMKYGDSDFFRYLKINDHFFDGGPKKIIELQTRREYEGFGSFPSFTGWDYYEYYRQLQNVDSLIGICVWCQTGGWSRFRNFTFLKNTSPWNELNTVTTLKIFREGLSVEEAAGAFFRGKNRDKLMKFLGLSDQVTKELLYDPAFSHRRLYFNRVRIPPLLHIFWDNVTVTRSMSLFYRTFSTDTGASVRAAGEALEKIKTMGRLARELEIPYDVQFHFDTFSIFALCRRLIYGTDSKDAVNRIRTLVREYEENYPSAYNFNLELDRLDDCTRPSRFMKAVIREGRRYRLRDRLFFNPFTTPLYLLAIRLMRNRLPKFVNKQGMPLEAILG